MPSLFDDESPLPIFRRDLELYPGPEEVDGSPTFNLYDPIRAKFFKLTWAEALIFQHHKQGMKLDDLAEDVEKTTTLRVTKDQIKFFFFDAYQQELLALLRPSEQIEKIKESKKQNIFMWVIYNYLFIKIPIFNPDKFLTRTLKYVKPFGSSTAFFLYGFASIIGLFMLFTRLGEFFHTFTYFFNVQGFIIYGLAISMVKMVHEFSHAYTAKKYGLYVPSMGLAFIVLWPVLYTDVTDGWKLKSRKQRLYISAAGIIAESVIAGLSTIGWFFTAPGTMNSIFFVVASITWVSTLVINLNPAVRFDGYYILCDLWGIDNLQYRSFNLARWKIRQFLLGMQMPCPEEHVSDQRFVGLFVYAIYTWIYRLFLYTSIAIFVYYKFTKVLGIFLFFVEIGIFLIWPLASELKAVYQLRSHLKANIRLFITASAVLMAFCWFVLPLPHTVSFNGITVPLKAQTIYIPYDGMITKVNIVRGQHVKVGDPIIEMASPQLDANIAAEGVQRKVLEKNVYLLGFEDKDRAYIPEKSAEQASSNQKWQAMQGQRQELIIKAEVDGDVYFLQDFLRRGLYLSKDNVIGKIGDPSSLEVVFFVPEDNIAAVKLGKKVEFRIPSSQDSFTGEITRINPTREEFLAYPQLASTYKGALPVADEKQSGALRMVDSYYVVHVKLDNHDPAKLRFGKTGQVYMQGPWRSLLGRVIHNVMQIFWKEGSI